MSGMIKDIFVFLQTEFFENIHPTKKPVTVDQVNFFRFLYQFDLCVQNIHLCFKAQHS